MAQNIYDENGRKVGEIKTDREKAEDDIATFSDNIGCLVTLVVGFVALIAITAWIMGITMAFQGEILYLLWMIPMVVATFIYAKKIMSENSKTPWGAFWRVLLLNTGVGAICMLLVAMISGSLTEGVMVAAVSNGFVFAILPAAIVAKVVRKKRK